MSSVSTTVSSNDTIKVLVDESRKFVMEKEDQEFLVEEFEWPEDSDWSDSFENSVDYWGFGNITKNLEGIATVKTRQSGKLSYSTLRDYDVLIIASYTEGYSIGEVEAIKKFVENGGGLLLMADPDYAANSVSRAFNVQFESERVTIGDLTASPGSTRTFRVKKLKFTTIVIRISRMYCFYITDFTEHPITEGIDEISFNWGVPITGYKTGKSLVRTSADTWADSVGIGSTGINEKGDDEDSGPFDIVLAMDKVGLGRAVFVGSSDSFLNLFTERDEGNLNLIVNAVKWLGEPGGPHKQYRPVVEQAQSVLSSAVSLLSDHKFTEAEQKFEEAITVFEESAEIYPTQDATSGVAEANNYIQQCRTGVEADEIFENASQLYDSREYEKAIEEYEKAKSLYEEIEYTDRIGECSTQVDESQNWISLREEAASLLEKAEDALKDAPDKYDPSGYEQTIVLYEQAKAKWQEYDDPDQVAACDEKITLCNDEIAQIQENKMMVTLGVTGVVIVVIVIVVVVIIVIRKRRPKVTAEEVTPPPEIPEAAPPEEEEALKALRNRYARGEITKEEYERLKSVLEK